MPKNNPCFGCTQETGRYPGCQMDCPRWAEWQEIYQQQKKREREQKAVNALLDNYVSLEKKKNKRGTRKPKR